MNHTSTSAPSPARGRGLQATRAVRPGDIIGVFAGPAAAVIAIPDSQHLDDTCSHCLATAATLPPSDDGTAAAKLRACTACRAVVYCSSACQMRDWQLAPHKLECKVFQRVVAGIGGGGGHRNRRALPTPVRALVQVLLRDESSRAALVGGLEGHGDAFRRVAIGGGGSSGANDDDDESTTSWQDMELQAMAALHYLGRSTDDERAKREAVEILCKLQVNSFNRLDADTGQTGLFLHPALAMANHSCLPNAYVQFSGRAAVLRAYQTIVQGQEVEISYIDQALPLAQRQASLKARYHFTCSCPRCKDDLDVYQACQLYPHPDLNSLSLAPDLPEFLQQQQNQTNGPSRAVVWQAHTARTSTSQDSSSSADSTRSITKQDLSRRWRLCQPFSLTTKEPDHSLLHDANMYFASRGRRYASSLALSSLLATRVEPVRQPFPDSPPRAKGLLMLAKLLANVAEAAAAAAGPPPTAASATAAAEKQVLGILASMDVPTTCEVLLRLVLRSATAPISSSSESLVSSSATVQQQQRYLIQPYHVEAREMLTDLESLPGRASERGLVRDLFRESPSAVGPSLGMQERLFLDMVIAKPLREVAGLADAVMQAEFGAA
ncbi:[histone H3]-lysine4/36 N-trimethyltransferase SMYD [Microdochium nivale]|nr:[histone H3]-lysine4/36 N-trimethyltransferase SMYD [Microdochium nivale]